MHSIFFIQSFFHSPLSEVDIERDEIVKNNYELVNVNFAENISNNSIVRSEGNHLLDIILVNTRPTTFDRIDIFDIRFVLLVRNCSTSIDRLHKFEQKIVRPVKDKNERSSCKDVLFLA